MRQNQQRDATLVAMHTVLVQLRVTVTAPATQSGVCKWCRRLVMDSPDITTRKLADKVTANQSITEAEWKDLVKFCNDNNSDFRARNIALLDHMKGTGHQAEALSISKKYINDPDEGVQTIAMDNIQRLNDPEWRQIIESKRSSGSALVRERADMILEKNR